MEYLYMSTAQKCGIVIPDIRLINDRYFASKRFNVICQNRDDHAKNFSFLCEDGKWSLAPARDVLR